MFVGCTQRLSFGSCCDCSIDSSLTQAWQQQRRWLRQRHQKQPCRIQPSRARKIDDSLPALFRQGPVTNPDQGIFVPAAAQRRYFVPDVDFTDEHVPAAITERCRNLLFNIVKGVKSVIITPVTRMSFCAAAACVKQPDAVLSARRSSRCRR